MIEDVLLDGLLNCGADVAADASFEALADLSAEELLSHPQAEEPLAQPGVEQAAVAELMAAHTEHELAQTVYEQQTGGSAAMAALVLMKLGLQRGSHR